jgi:uncharacterized membrane protein
MFDTNHFHPMIVHFPVALITIGFILDFLNLIFKKEICLSKAGFYLLLTGTAAAIVAVLTGLLFTANLQGAVGELKEQHETLAFITLAILLVASIIRLFIVIKKNESKSLKWLVFLLYLLGVVFVGITGNLGGTMVFNYMIGL